MGKFINKITVVSSLFNISRERWKHSGFPPGVDRYKSWVVNLLRQDIGLYFYTDEYYYDFILENRIKYDPTLEKTVLIKISLDDLHFYQKYFNEEACLMSSPNFIKTIFHKDSADMNYPLYHIVNFSKIELVKRSFLENKFKSDYFFWVDAGGLRHVTNENDKNWLDLDNECFNTSKITHFSHNKHFEIYPNKSDYFRSQNRNIQGTAWVVPKDKVEIFYDMIDKEITSIIKDRIVGSDEKIYDFLYVNNKDLYQLKIGGWFEFYNQVCVFPKNIFLDMGMNKQQGLEHFIDKLNIDKSWEIHCFEPNPLLSLKNKFNELNVIIHNKAVWVNNGTIIFGQYGNNGTSQGSLIEETGGSKYYNDFYDKIEVETIDIYEFLSQFDSKDNIYIKMDIEWSEYKVLEYLISKKFPTNIKKIWIEWHGKDQEEYISRKNDIEIKLKNLNIELENWI
jgi:FkbM family methyltransferase